MTSRNFSDFKSVWEKVDAFYAGRAEAVAAGAGDNTEVNGLWLDRMSPAGDMYQSCAIFIFTSSALADSQTLSLAANLQDAVDSSGTGAADFGLPMAKKVVITGGVGVAAEEQAKAKLGFDLTMAKRFIRVQFTPDLGASGTDTTDVFAIVVFGGGKAVSPLGTLANS